MITRSSVFRSTSILSVKVCETMPRLVFVITTRPSLVAAVGDILREANKDLSVVWLPSIERARHRLEWDKAAMVILDDVGESADAVVSDLLSESPETQVLIYQQDVASAS